MSDGLADIESLKDLARVLRQLRRREGREQYRPELTYREIAVKTGWSVGAISGYFSGTLLPSTIRFDTLIQLLGATPAEQGVLATARDRVAERRAVPGGEPAGSPRNVPRQLPADVYGFTGRDHQLAQLDGLLAQPGVRVAAVSGTAGVGKTALAVHWAHRVADRFPDGQLYADLRGFDANTSPLAPAAVARSFLTALGAPAAELPVGFEELIALYRSTLATRRVLILLDNAHDAAQVRPLLPTMPGSVMVGTSRDQLAGLVATNGARSVKLDLLSLAEARTMLARRLGSGPVAAEPEATTEIIERCSRLPLALAVVAARAAIDELPLTGLARELGETGRRLDALGAGDAAADVRTVFSWSYRTLPDEAARLFRLTGLHPAPDLGVAAAASLAAVTPAQARVLLVGLTRANLLTEHSPGRFTCHDLLRAYAGELAVADVDTTAVRRMVDHYCATAHAAASLLHEVWDVDAPPNPAPGVRSEPLADRVAAFNWFTAEYPVLLATVRIAVRHQFNLSACHLATAVIVYQGRRALWAQWVETLGVALCAAERLEDPAWQARFHKNLIFPYAWTGEHERSVHHAKLAIKLYRALGDDAGQARCHRALCMTFERQGKYRQALHHALRSRDLLQGTDDRVRAAYAFNSVGWYQALVGDFTEALDNCRRAIPLLQSCGDPSGEANAWDSLGYVHHHLGQHREAMDCYKRALVLYHSTGDRPYEVLTLDHLGDTLLAAGDHEGASDAWRDTLVIMEATHQPGAAEIRTKLADVRRTRGSGG